MGDADRIHIEGLTPGDVAILKNVAEAAAEKAVKKTLVAMGLDPDDPLKAQQDFGIMRYVNEKIRHPEFKEDLSWVRRARKREEGVFGKALLTAVATGVAGFLMAFWIGFKSMLGPPPGP